MNEDFDNTDFDNIPLSAWFRAWLGLEEDEALSIPKIQDRRIFVEVAYKRVCPQIVINFIVTEDGAVEITQ